MHINLYLITSIFIFLRCTLMRSQTDELSEYCSLGFSQLLWNFGKCKSCHHKKVSLSSLLPISIAHFPNNFTHRSRSLYCFFKETFTAFLHSAVDWNFLNRKCESKFGMKMITWFNLSSTVLFSFFATIFCVPNLFLCHLILVPNISHRAHKPCWAKMLPTTRGTNFRCLDGSTWSIKKL